MNVSAMIMPLALMSQLAFSYQGSSANQVWNTVTAETYDVLQDKEITVRSFFSAGVNILKENAVRTVEQKDDIIPYFDKLVHPNGMCLRGNWQITEPSVYSGYFKQGSEGIIIARASTTLSNTKRGSFRGFGLAGKIFPTTDDKEQVKTANFFQIDNLIGTYADHYSDVQMTNEPGLFPPLSLGVVSLARIGIVVNNALSAADRNPGLRQVYSISQLSEQGVVTTPKYLATQVRGEEVKSNQIDFRDELFEHLNLNGQITFDIKVSEDKRNWQTIGAITFTEAVASVGCDHQLHFHHPRLVD